MIAVTPERRFVRKLQAIAQCGLKSGLGEDRPRAGTTGWRSGTAIPQVGTKRVVLTISDALPKNRLFVRPPSDQDKADLALPQHRAARRANPSSLTALGSPASDCGHRRRGCTPRSLPLSRPVPIRAYRASYAERNIDLINTIRQVPGVVLICKRSRRYLVRPDAVPHFAQSQLRDTMC